MSCTERSLSILAMSLLHMQPSGRMGCSSDGGLAAGLQCYKAELHVIPWPRAECCSLLTVCKLPEASEHLV